MGKHLRHPEARAEIARATLDKRNAEIREKCKTPGFGYVVLLYAFGLRSPDTGERGPPPKHAVHVRTYGEAIDLRDREMATGNYEKCWIIQKVWDANMSITRDDQRDRAEAYAKWVRDREDEDL